MKLSHILIATLVTSALVANSQTGNKLKEPKTKAKTEKKVKQKLRAEKTVKADTTLYQPQPFHCPACGRG